MTTPVYYDISVKTGVSGPMTPNQIPRCKQRII